MSILRHSLVAYVEMNLVKGKGYYVDSEKGGEAKRKVEQATVKERASERDLLANHSCWKHKPTHSFFNIIKYLQ